VRRSSMGVAFLALAVTLTQSGCALLIAKGPPENHAALNDFGCTESASTVVLDVAWGIPVTGLMALGLAMGKEEPGVADIALYVGIPGGLALTSIFVGSDRIMRCREALDALEERRRAITRPAPGADPAPPGWVTPWGPASLGPIHPTGPERNPPGGGR